MICVSLLALIILAVAVVVFGFGFGLGFGLGFGFPVANATETLENPKQTNAIINDEATIFCILRFFI